MPKLKERLTEQEKLRKAYRQIMGGRLAAENDNISELAKLLNVSDSTAYRKHSNPETYKLNELCKIAKRYKFTPDECALIFGVL